MVSAGWRSGVALRLSIEGLPGNERYMYVFTKWTVCDLDVEVKQWNVVAGRMRGRLSYVRVFELHPGGHGLHVHVVTSRRCELDELFGYCHSTIWGYVHPTKWEGSAGRYLSGYLSPDQREGALKGRRLWASNSESKELSRDIVVDSDWANLVRSFGPKVIGFTKARGLALAQYTK